MTTSNLKLWLTAVTLACFSCTGASGGDAEDTGTVRLSVTNAPADAPCLQVTVAGVRTVQQSIALTPGESTTFLLHGLPLGNDQFSAAAFATACSAVTPGSVANWVSDPVAVTLTAGAIADVTLIMHRNGRANVAVDFQDDPDGGTAPLEAGPPTGTDAGTDAGSAMSPGTCSPDAVVTTTGQGIAALKALFASNTTFCLQQQTGSVSGSTVSVCTTPACSGAPNTCAAALGSATFSLGSTVASPVIDANGTQVATRATTPFTATGNITVTGGASATLFGLPESCSDLQLSASGATFTGTLNALHSVFTNTDSVQYAISDVQAHANTIAVTGCGAIGSLLNAAASFVAPPLEQAVAETLSQQTFDVSCTNSSGQ